MQFSSEQRAHRATADASTHAHHTHLHARMCSHAGVLLVHACVRVSVYVCMSSVGRPYGWAAGCCKAADDDQNNNSKLNTHIIPIAHVSCAVSIGHRAHEPITICGACERANLAYVREVWTELRVPSVCVRVAANTKFSLSRCTTERRTTDVRTH